MGRQPRETTTGRITELEPKSERKMGTIHVASKSLQTMRPGKRKREPTVIDCNHLGRLRGESVPPNSSRKRKRGANKQKSKQLKGTNKRWLCKQGSWEKKTKADDVPVKFQVRSMLHHPRKTSNLKASGLEKLGGGAADAWPDTMQRGFRPGKKSPGDWSWLRKTRVNQGLRGEFVRLKKARIHEIPSSGELNLFTKRRK